MTPSTLFKSAFLLVTAAVFQAQAAVVSVDEINEDSQGFDAGITTSLITTGQSSLLSVSATTPSLFTVAGLNNGSASNASSNATLTFYNGLDTNSATITFALAQRYNITSIRSLTGWTDSFFGSQVFTVRLETDFSGTYVALPGSFGETPYTAPAPAGFPTVNDDGFAIRTTITEDTTGFLGTNVTGVRFVFTDPYPTIPNFNGTVIRELSVSGTAVPEPTSALLVALGAVATCSRRRKASR